MPNFYDQVYAVVREIPQGKVTSYGRIAKMLGSARAARAVGYALNALKDKQADPAFKDIPWQRVVNSKGFISISNREYSATLQAELLRAEGVPVDDQFRLPLADHLWSGLSWPEVELLLNKLD